MKIESFPNEQIMVESSNRRWKPVRRLEVWKRKRFTENIGQTT